MGSLELVTWLAAGLAVGGAYAYFLRGEAHPWWMPLVVGTLGSFGAAWVVLLVSPDPVDQTLYRPALLAIAFVGAGVFVLGYHLYRVSATPRTQ